MTPSFTDQYSVYPSHPSRSLPLKSLMVSDLPVRGGTSTVFSFFSTSLSAAGAMAAVRASVSPSDAAQRVQMRFMVCLVREIRATWRRYQRGRADAMVHW